MRSSPSRRSTTDLARLLAALLTAAALAGAAAAAPRPGLVPAGRDGYAVSLPAGWRFVDATYPSDHDTHLWYDPGNALRRLGVVTSRCAGCVEGFARAGAAQLRRLLPAATTRVERISAWRVAFEAYNTDPWNPYPDRGLLVVIRRGSASGGFVRVDLWLPERERALASAILASFELAR